MYTRAMETNEPEVYLDRVIMAKHFAVVLAISLVCNIFGWLSNIFPFTMFCELGPVDHRAGC